MPPDRLNPPADEADSRTAPQPTTATTSRPPERTEDAVLHVLSGTPLGHVADCFQIEPVTLAAAVRLYQQAGREALRQQRSGPGWQQLYIEFTDWTGAETTAIDHLAPLLSSAGTDAATAGWWFIRKHPCWRLRLQQGAHHGRTEISSALDELVTKGHLRRWWYGTYEPEMVAFGGAAGIGIAHELFCADSRAILNTLPVNQERIGRRELSVLLCTVMFRAAGLEWYEQGDAWHRVARERRGPADIPRGRLTPMIEALRHLTSADLDADGLLLGEAGSLTFAAEWAAAFRNAGRTLGVSAREGTLQRGLRQVLAYHVIFHWNRLGLPVRTQGVLAAAASEAILAR